MDQGTIEYTKSDCQDKYARIDPVTAAGAMPPNDWPVSAVQLKMVYLPVN